MTPDDTKKKTEYRADLPRVKRWACLLNIAWPLIVANSFWNLQLTIDRIFLGEYSTVALGAAMTVMGVFWVPMALLQGTANYVMTFVAQYHGANEDNRIGSAVWQSIHVSIIGGILFMGLCFLTTPFFNMVGHPDATRSLEIEYFNALAWSALPTALVAAISGFFTGLGETKVVILINLIGLILNAGLDWLLIFGNAGAPKLGVAGAGYATAIATYGAAILGFFLLFTKLNQRRYRVRSDWALDQKLLKQFLKFGVPSGMQWALEGSAFTVFLIIMGNTAQGETALAASSIAVTIMLLSVLPSMGIAQAVMSLAGKYVGEKNPAATRAVTWDGVSMSLIYMACAGLSFVIVPEAYIVWFHNDQNPALWSQVEGLTRHILMIVALFTMFDSAYLNISFSLKGAGDTRFVSLIALLLPWPLMVLPAYLVRHQTHAALLAWAFCALYSICIAGILIWRFRQGHWQNMSVIHPTVN
jgi:MATE family multidrug resistance protein